MPVLDAVTIDFDRTEEELDYFKNWFQQHPRFTERQVVNELRRYNNLCPLIGYLGTPHATPDLHKHEFEIQGVFRADYVVGNSKNRHFVLVEFEGGTENSIFGPGHTNQMRNWGTQLQRGFSQIADWSWAKNDTQQTTIYKNAFGCDYMTETYVLVCGRDDSMNNTERSRLSWRHNQTIISGAKVLFMTYDDLLNHFDGFLDILRSL
jgi:Domain of unknown function (DUF4263)